MEQAGMKTHVPMFLFSSIGISVGLGLAVLALTRWLACQPSLAAVIGALVPYCVVRSQAQPGGLRPSRNMLPEAIDLLGRAIRAGHPLSAGHEDGGGRDARSRSRASSAGPTRSTGSACPSRMRCSPWRTG